MIQKAQAAEKASDGRQRIIQLCNEQSRASHTDGPLLPLKAKESTPNEHMLSTYFKPIMAPF